MVCAHVITFWLSCLSAATHCHGTTDSCAANLGLLQKSYHISTPIYVPHANSGSDVAILGLDQKDFSLTRSPNHTVIHSHSSHSTHSIHSAVPAPEAASAPVAVPVPETVAHAAESHETDKDKEPCEGHAYAVNCGRGMYSPEDNTLCVSCDGSVRRRARRRAPVCTPCAVGYTSMPAADACTADRWSGVLLDYAFVHFGQCKDGLVQPNGALFATDISFCAQMCRVSVYCEYFSYTDPSSTVATLNCEMFSALEYCLIDPSRSDTRWKSFSMTTDFTWLHGGRCHLNATVVEGEHIFECSQRAQKTRSGFFSWAYKGIGPSGTCVLYPHTNGGNCTEIPAPGHHTYRMMVISERQDNSRQFVGRQNKTMGVTFEGNGLLAQSLYAALTGSHLAVYRVHINELASLHGNDSVAYMMPSLEDLFHCFDIMVSNSGGSWYLGFLSYSAYFRDLQEQLGRTPGYAGLIWNSKMTNAHAIMDLGLNFMGTSWYEGLRALQAHQIGHANPVELGNFSTMQTWARYRLWIIANALSTGTASIPININRSYGYRLTSRHRSISLPISGFIPSGLSLRLNAQAADYRSPYPFCLGSATDGDGNCFGIQMNHFGRCENYTKIDPDSVFAYPGKMLLSGILAASSAAFAMITLGTAKDASEKQSAFAAAFQQYMSGKLDALDSEFLTQATAGADMVNVWAVPGMARPYERGNMAVIQGAFHTSHEIMCSIFATADGAAADNTGIAQALTAGVDVVTSFMNNADFYGQLKKISVDGCELAVVQDDLNLLIQQVLSTRAISSVSPIYVRVEFKQVQTHTRYNIWFGVGEGHPVTINMILMKTFLDVVWMEITFAVGSPHWGIVVQTLVDAVRHIWNRQKVVWNLDRSFQLDLGPSTTNIGKLPPASYMWFYLDPIVENIMRELERLKFAMNGLEPGQILGCE